MVKSFYKLQTLRPRYELKTTTEKKQGKVLWFTGLSGAGKSTIANALEKKLKNQGLVCRILDGDILRCGLNSNVGFSEEDRMENIRRTAEVAKLFSEIGVVVIVAFITPTQAMRDRAKNIIGLESFSEVFVKSSLEVCEMRDVKGLYAKARRGEIKEFTGISAIYETPKNPDLIIETSALSIAQSVDLLLQDVLYNIPNSVSWR